ncbi:hypothetical protein [Pseudonocardia sp.]|uniref:hypothetical protein n=1 Tax=Pseudonocardia sp. TaxID=60912 RepID=UPI002634269C|nr:hypothetical protein [Pseudonocardia sp.]
MTTYVLTDLLRDRAIAEPDATAFVVGAGSEVAGSLVFGEWAAQTEAVARALTARGLRRGDRAGLFFDRLEFVDYAVAYCAVLPVGAVAAHLPTTDAAVAARLGAQAGCVGVIRGSGPPPAAPIAGPAGRSGRARWPSAPPRSRWTRGSPELIDLTSQILACGTRAGRRNRPVWVMRPSPPGRAVSVATSPLTATSKQVPGSQRRARRTSWSVIRPRSSMAAIP